MNNYTTNKINIQDYDLIVNSISHERDKQGNKLVIINCSLNENEVNPCPHCGSISNKVKDYYTRNIKYIETFGYPSIIRFRQKRLICSDCNKTFNLSSSIVSKGCSISNPTKIKVIQKVKSKQSFKEIAEQVNISNTSTISAFINSVAISRNELTEIICIDEFKANTEHGKYAFIMGDPVTGNIIDILPSRKQEYIYHYFNKIKPEERFRVKYLVSDMYESFRTVKKELFPNAIHIVDRFHWIRFTTEAFNKLRIRIMKEYLKEYEISKDIDLKRELSLYIRIMKSNYKLFLANKYRKEETYFTSEIKLPGYKDKLSKQEIIEFILNTNKELENGYFILQELYKISIFSNEENAKENILNWINEVKSLNIKEFNVVCNTYKSWLNEIVNSFIINDETKKRLTNGFIEGKNNLCKVIKRLGFGYKKFELLRNRILFISNKNQTIKNK